MNLSFQGRAVAEAGIPKLAVTVVLDFWLAVLAC